ncbi:MAG: zinc ribbon domain-containing protein [Acidimicrobiales bacterium]
MLLCQRCQRPSAHAVFKLRTWFTLFFIPIFPISIKYATACPMCGAGTKIDKAQAEHLESVAAQKAAAPAEMTPDGPITPYPSVEAPIPLQSPSEVGADSEQNRTASRPPLTEPSIGEPPAPGWWLASDEKWYPPELHPDAR